MENGIQIMTVEERKRLTLSGAVAVDSFTDERIRLKVKTGGLTITGAKLKISNFSESTGAFSCDGEISGISFSAKKEGVLKRLFK